MLDNLQRRQQLGLGESRATAFVGQGRQRTDHRLVALELAEITLHAPHRHQRFAVDAITLFDARQQRAVLRQQGLALAYTHGGQGAVEVFPDRAGEFRLAAVGLDHAHVRGDAGKGGIEDGGGDTGSQGFDTERGHPFVEALRRLDRQVVIDLWLGGDRGRGCGKGLQRFGVGCGGLFRAGN